MTPTLDYNLFTGLDARSDYTTAYVRALKTAQGGKHNNLAKRIRYYTMWQLAARCRPLPGRWVECGCWHGHSTLMLADLMPSRTFLDVYDSFEGGLSEFSPEDHSEWFPARAEQKTEREHYASSFKRLSSLVAGRNVRLHKGWIPEVFDHRDLNRIGFASIDVDLYAPTLASLEYVWPRLCEGGAVYLDDYGCNNFPGATTAVDEFFKTVPQHFFMALGPGGAYAIK